MNLTPALCSIHTHSTLCDGKNTLAEMAAAGFAAGVRYFGFSNHSHTPIPMDRGEVLPADMTVYRETVLSLRKEYAGRMEILLGLEVDSCADVTPEGFEYWIGSVHYLHDPDSGTFYPVDWDERHLAVCCVEMFHGNFPALIGRYYADVAGMAARKPTILGHIDLITKFNGGGALFEEEDRHYRAMALGALHAADPSMTLLEINTGAMSRGYRKTPYPAQFLLEEWRSMGGKIILTADAHSTDAVVYGYEPAAQQARAAGYKETMFLTEKGLISCPL